MPIYLEVQTCYCWTGRSKLLPRMPVHKDWLLHKKYAFYRNVPSSSCIQSKSCANGSEDHGWCQIWKSSVCTFDGGDWTCWWHVPEPFPLYNRVLAICMSWLDPWQSWKTHQQSEANPSTLHEVGIPHHSHVGRVVLVPHQHKERIPSHLAEVPLDQKDRWSQIWWSLAVAPTHMVQGMPQLCIGIILLL